MSVIALHLAMSFASFHFPRTAAIPTPIGPVVIVRDRDAMKVKDNKKPPVTIPTGKNG